MIKINKGILAEGDVGGNSVKLLWDLLNVIGMRYAIIAVLEDEELQTNYEDKHEIIEWKENRIAIFNCDNEENFLKVLKMLSEACITDFYITVNSFYNNILNKLYRDDFFTEDEFLIKDYLLEFPRTIHIEEDKFYIDFEMFKEYTYQMQRVAKRYMR